jgi:hypothetical protein
MSQGFHWLVRALIRDTRCESRGIGVLFQTKFTGHEMEKIVGIKPVTFGFTSVDPTCQ